MYSQMKEDFGFTDDPLDPYYFSLTTMSTVGYGDFSPKTQRAKILVMTQQAVILSEITGFLSKIIP
jgi:voltage-gated potassium channel